jgi:hypothetical protein
MGTRVEDLEDWTDPSGRTLSEDTALQRFAAVDVRADPDRAQRALQQAAREINLLKLRIADLEDERAELLARLAPTLHHPDGIMPDEDDDPETEELEVYAAAPEEGGWFMDEDPQARRTRSA